MVLSVFLWFFSKIPLGWDVMRWVGEIQGGISQSILDRRLDRYKWKYWLQQKNQIMQIKTFQTNMKQRFLQLRLQGVGFSAVSIPWADVRGQEVTFV